MNRPPEQRCQLCKFYEPIDSGYGKCFRYPPKWIRIRLVPIQYEAKCPHVGRHRQACGEFESRSNQKKEAKDENLH